MIKFNALWNRFNNSNSTFKHVSLIAGGTVFAQGFNIILMPILARIYAPEDFGILAVFSSVMSITLQLCFMNYHCGIALPKSNRYSHALIYICFAVQSCFIFIFSAVLFGFGDIILNKLSMDNLIPYKWLLPVAIIGAGWYSALTLWAVREKTFSAIAKTKITQSLSGGAAKIILGLLGYRPLGLIAGFIVGQAGGATSLFRAVTAKSGIPKTNIRDMKRCLIKYRKFPLYGTWSNLVNAVTTQITPILVSGIYGAAETGYFAIAQQLLQIPMVFIGQAIGHVFLQRASTAKHEGGLTEVSIAALETLLRFGLFPILLLSFLGPQIFAVLLGPEWSQAGIYARLLGPMVALAFIFSPLSNLFNIFNRQELYFALEISYSVVQIGAFVAVSEISGVPVHAVAAFAISGSIMIFIRLIALLCISGINLELFIRTCIKTVPESIALMTVPWTLSLLSVPDVLLIGSSFLLCIVFSIRIFHHYRKNGYI